MKVIGGIIICEVLQLYGLVIIVILFGTNLKYFCVLFFHHWSTVPWKIYNTFYYFKNTKAIKTQHKHNTLQLCLRTTARDALC